MSNDNQFNFAHTSATTDSSTTLLGRTGHSIGLIGKLLVVTTLVGADKFNKGIDSLANFNGNEVDDFRFISKALRELDQIDMLRIADVETVDKVGSILKDELKKAKFYFFTAFKYADLSTAHQTRVKLIATKIRSHELYSDTSKYSDKQILELAFKALKSQLEKEIKEENKLSDEHLKLLKTEGLRIAKEEVANAAK